MTYDNGYSIARNWLLYTHPIKMYKGIRIAFYNLDSEMVCNTNKQPLINKIYKRIDIK